ncbi:hypothetical protein B296_00045340 [Ensete ventricosum]|uniref:Uncharacterized protein n=1 Tax=Ensete ventricosum TaxID=4639 RepID=A0A426XWE9_ENSVE|nr:hypothetical protein B296_00045340 [Ensete ventricosum]
MFRSVYPTLSRNFKILAITNLLAHGKSYKYGFMKKRDCHKLCAKSSFVRFIAHSLRILKYWPLPTYYSMGSYTSTVL